MSNLNNLNNNDEQFDLGRIIRSLFMQSKLIIAITGLVVAVGTLIATLGLGQNDSVPYQTIVLNSPEAYEHFLNNHPAG